MAVAGRVLIIPKGEYVGTVSYRPLDLVSFNGGAWLCRQNCIAIEPSETASEYWFKMSDIVLANNLITETEGFALDARQGKNLSEMIASMAANQTVIETTVTNLTATVNGLMGTNIAAAYDSSATYNVGDYVTYNNDLYVCITKITTPEAFKAAHWKHCYIMDEINDKVTEIVEEVVNTTVATEIGNLTIGAGLYADCATAAATAAKVVDMTGFALKKGARITVNFQYSNTAATPTLNVNSTGAKAIRYRSSDSVYTTFKDIPYGPVTLSYNGTYWVAESALKEKVAGFTSGNYAAVTGLAYDATTKKLGLKVGGASTEIVPFLSGSFENVELIGADTSKDSTVAFSTTKTEGMLIAIATGYYNHGITISGSYETIVDSRPSGSNVTWFSAVKCTGETTMSVQCAGSSTRNPGAAVLLWLH